MTEPTDSTDKTIQLGGGAWRKPDSGADTEAGPEVAAGDATSDSTAERGPEAREGSEAFAPGEGETDTELPTTGLSPVNIRNFSVKCGHCGRYQVIVSFRRIDDEWNEYVYECEEPPCTEDASRSRTVLEIPVDLDEYARRDPAWRGGKIHAGAD